MNASLNDNALLHARERWDDGEPLIASQLIASNPSLKSARPVILELAYEEYCRRSASGEMLDVQEFCDGFSICKLSLRRRIEIHEYLHENIDEWFQEQDWPEVGERCGDFSLIRELGRSAKSRVYLAKQRSLSDRLVVLKFSPHGFREARLMSTLEHPNIVPILSIEEDAERGLAAICMPYLSPWTLTDFLDVAFCNGDPPRRFSDVLDQLRSERRDVQVPTVEQEPISIFLARCSYTDGVIHIMSSAANALRHTHQRGIFHLDLKPSNILMTEHGAPMLMDFDLSAASEMKISYGGTLPYMSPEQLRQCFLEQEETFEVGESSDIYSLGVLTHQLLTGKLPFGPSGGDRTNSEQVAKALLAKQSQGLPELADTCAAAGVSNFLRSSLAYDVRDRPQNMQEVGPTFRAALTARRRLLRWLQANRVLLALFLATVLIAVSFGTFLIATQDPADVRWHSRGLQHLEQGEHDQAIAWISKSIDVNPSHDVYWYSRGRARQGGGDLPGAVSDYDEAHELHPRPEHLARIAHCYALQNDLGRAISHFERAIEGDLHTLGVLVCLGRCHFSLQQFQSARNAYEHALEIDPDSWRAHHGLALVHTRIATSKVDKVPPEALYHIQRAVELHPNSWLVAMDATWISVEYSRTHDDHTELKRAIDHFERSLELGIPKPAADSFRDIPELNGVQRFVSLIDGYAPTDPSPPKDMLFPDPLLHHSLK